MAGKLALALPVVQKRMTPLSSKKNQRLPVLPGESGVPAPHYVVWEAEGLSKLKV
jgi:hypothetical protein